MLGHLKSVFKSSIIYSFGNLSSKLVGFILVPLYTSHFKPYFYGIIGLVDVTSVALASIFNLGLYYALFRWYWDQEHAKKQKSIFFTSSFFLFLVSIFITLAFLPFKTQVSSLLFDSPDYSYLSILMVICAGFQIITIMPATLMRLQERPILYTVTNLLRLVVSLLLTIYFIVYLKRGVEGIYEAQIIGHMAYLLIIPVYLYKNMEFKFDWPVLKSMLKFSAPVVFTSISAIIISLADRYLLKYFSGLSDSGIYSFGQKLANTINVFVVTSINLAVSPILYKMINDPGNKRFYSKMMTYSAYVVLFFVIGLSIFGIEVIKILAKDIGYWPAFKVIPFISFAILFTLMRDNAAIGLNIQKRTKLIAVIVIVCSVLNVIFNIILIPFLDIVGASLAYLSSQLISYLLILRYSQKYYFIPYENLKLLKMVLLSILIIVFALFINRFDLLIRLIAKSALMISFPIALYFMNFYEEVEIIRIKQVFVKWKNPKNWSKNK